MTPPPRQSSELFDCDRINAYLESYLLGQIPPPERRAMRLHIHRCAACFGKVTERDPLQLFAPLADEERPAGAWGDFDAAILEAVSALPAKPTGTLFPLRRRLVTLYTPARAAAGLLALAGLAAALVFLPSRQATPPEGRQVVTARPPAPAPAVSPGAPLPQTVEQIVTSDERPVQVFTMAWAPGEVSPAAGAPVTELVLIVDGGIDL